MAGHGVRLQKRHAVNHVRTLAAVRSKRALPSIAAIEEQNFVVAALGAYALDHRRDPVEAANAAVGFRQRCELLVGQRVGRGRLLGNAEAFEKIFAG